MKKTETRISAFIASLEGTGMADGSDAILLTADMNSFGGEGGGGANTVNHGNCSNHDCSGSTNYLSCKNYGSCGRADNFGDCKALVAPTKPPQPEKPGVPTE